MTDTLFLTYSYVKSHLDNDSCLPIYKTIPAIIIYPIPVPYVQNVRDKVITLHSAALTCKYKFNPSPEMGLTIQHSNENV